MTAYRAKDPVSRRVTIDILGNADAFVHANIWPRYECEPHELVWRPVSSYNLDSWQNPDMALGKQHAQLRNSITDALRALTLADTVRVTVD